eukprot:6353649-Prymnesium_polylepis.1
MSFVRTSSNLSEVRSRGKLAGGQRARDWTFRFAIWISRRVRRRTVVGVDLLSQCLGDVGMCFILWRRPSTRAALDGPWPTSSMMRHKAVLERYAALLRCLWHGACDVETTNR